LYLEQTLGKIYRFFDQHNNIIITNQTYSETTLAAISSSIWNNFQQGSPQLYLMKYEKGCLGITSAGQGYVLAAYGGDKISLGLLRGRLESLSVYFTRVFEQLNN
jgi:hypothetical protein